MKNYILLGALLVASTALAESGEKVGQTATTKTKASTVTATGQQIEKTSINPNISNTQENINRGDAEQARGRLIREDETRGKRGEHQWLYE